MQSVHLRRRLGVLEALRQADPDAPERVLICRAVTAVAILRVLWHLPPGEVLHDYAALLDRAEEPAGQRPTWTPARYAVTRSLAMTSVAAWGAGVDHPAVRATANASYASLQRYVVGVHPDLWSFTSNLNVHLALLSLVEQAPPGAEPAPADLVALGALRALFAGMYLQSGLAKVTVTGWRWGDGRTLRAALGELGTPLGKEVARAPAPVLAAASTGTLLFELGYAPALLWQWRHRAWFALASAGFHSSVKATMGISFWHVSWFSVPLLAGSPATVRRVAGGLRAARPRTRAGALAATVGLGALAAWPFVQTRYQRRRRARFEQAAREPSRP